MVSEIEANDAYLTIDISKLERTLMGIKPLLREGKHIKIKRGPIEWVPPGREIWKMSTENDGESIWLKFDDVEEICL